MKESIDYKGYNIDLTPPWTRITLKEVFEVYASISLEDAIKKEIFEEVMVNEIEPRLGINKPIFIKDYPAPMAALSKIRYDDPNIAERFELYICGIELANGYTELTNIKEMKKRFDIENKKRNSIGKKQYYIPEELFMRIEKLPDCAGIALGIDRLIMLFSNNSEIDQVVTLLPEEI
jgi:lysyl-tRNA synthetase class 2